MVATHGTDVVSSIGSSLTSGDGEPVNSDGVERQSLSTSKEAAKRDFSIPEGLEKPRLACTP